MQTTRKAALVANETQYFTGLACKHGHIAARRAKTGECLTCRQIAVQVWRDKNPMSVAAHNQAQHKKFSVELAARTRAYYAKNTAALRIQKQEYQRTNLHIYAKIGAKRRAAKLQRTPVWLTSDDHWMIEQAYELAAVRTKMFGFAWHVDHIVPLQGKLVSGLHAPNNLRVIPGAENIRKSNHFQVAT
jgi:hypothetical protein